MLGFTSRPGSKSTPWRQCFVVVATLTSLLTEGRAEDSLSSAQVDLVNARLAEGALKSWELGTRAQAILEFEASPYSVFSDTSLPPPSAIPNDVKESLDDFFDIARDIVTAIEPTSDDAQPLMEDGSAADPASNGVCVLLANWTGQDDGTVDYGGAAKRQLQFLLGSTVPKTSEGAISHRVDQLQLWNDFIYMVPPFLAYYGAINLDKKLVAEAYSQIRLYRDQLRDPATGMWRHVMLGTSGNDPGFWTTGNGWAAAGMLRVHATIKNSRYANDFKKEQKNLEAWVSEVHAAIYKHLDETNVFPNYANRSPTDGKNFYDAAGTALVAASVYRASTHLGQHKYVQFAERSRKTLFSPEGSNAPDSNTFEGYPHFTQDGWLRPVVNPHSYGQEGSNSAEGQAFVVMLHTSYNEWKAAGSHSEPGASVSRHNFLSITALLALLVGQAVYIL